MYSPFLEWCKEPVLIQIVFAKNICIFHISWFRFEIFQFQSNPAQARPHARCLENITFCTDNVNVNVIKGSKTEQLIRLTAIPE